MNFFYFGGTAQSIRSFDGLLLTTFLLLTSCENFCSATHSRFVAFLDFSQRQKIQDYQLTLNPIFMGGTKESSA